MGDVFLAQDTRLNRPVALKFLSSDLVDESARRRFEQDEGAVLEQYALRPEERRAIAARDFRALYDMGLHPYLGGQLARFIYGNEAGKGAAVAAVKLVESLQRGKS